MILRPWLVAALVLPLTAQSFTWQRQIRPGGKGPQRLEVDLALLGGSRAALADLRLKDASGAEVPYVLVPPAKGEAAWVRARLLPVPATRLASGVELDLGTVVRTGRLRLEGLKAPFLKRFQLEGSGDRQHWSELVGDGSLFDLPEDGLRLLSVDFPAGDYRYLRVLWNDRSSAPLALPLSASAQRSTQPFAPPLAALDFQRRAAEPAASRFSVRLPGPALPIRALVLDVEGEGPLLRQAKVQESRLAQGVLAPTLLGESQLKRAQRGEASAADLRVPMEMPQGTELDIRVEDGSNAPLALKGVKAELEPQPWIYFVARDGEPLTALCGDARLARPRYDLEALRDQLTVAGTANATWGPSSVPASAAPASASLDGGPGALLDSKLFRFRRAVPAGAPGLTALVLDAHVLAHSSQLADLRLVNQEGRQIPYLLEQRDEPLSLELALAPGRAKGQSSFYTLALPQAGLSGARLVLETRSRLFQRQVLLREEAADGVVRELAAVSWGHGDPETLAPPLVVPLASLGTQSLTVEVAEGDNQALPLTSARLLLPTWRLRFFQPQGPLTLCYGQELAAPQYDIALLADRLRDVPAREVQLEALEAAAGDRIPGMQKVFWVVLAGAVVAMVAVLGRMLKDPPVV